MKVQGKKLMDRRHFVVVGASQAGCWISKTLRQEGFKGKITMIGEESYYPYERPPLSKDVLLGKTDIESTYFFKPESYKDDDIEVLLNTRVQKISCSDKNILLQDGRLLSWDRLALATGSRVRRLEVEGSGLDGIHYLRSLNDTRVIKESAKPDSTVVIVGGGWIGLECAATLKTLGCNPIVIESSDRLCARAVAPDISAWMNDFHTKNGIDIRLNTSVKSFKGDGSVTRVCLSDNSQIDCSSVVIGIGVLPNVELAEEAGLLVDNGIVVDDLCATSDKDIFAAGDVANHPNNFLKQRVRLESWDNAMKQGISAGISMLGKGKSYSEIPWFWSQQFDANIQIIGIPDSWDEAVVRGTKTANEFTEFYLKDNQIVGAVAVNNNREIRVTKRLMQSGKKIESADLTDSSKNIQTLV
ncbi:MAG: hypothetical protein CMD87_01710 [Gammaproteobacteria bacterium]|nr:hypothetical protein [Gammaproteobacteria bacterium]